MEVLFTFLAERYERRSVLELEGTRFFPNGTKIFKDPMTTMAAVDRLVHHAIILEFDGESVRAPRTKGEKPTRLARHPLLRLHYVPVAYGSRDSVPPKGVAPGSGPSTTTKDAGNQERFLNRQLKRRIIVIAHLFLLFQRQSLRHASLNSGMNALKVGYSEGHPARGHMTNRATAGWRVWPYTNIVTIDGTQHQCFGMVGGGYGYGTCTLAMSTNPGIHLDRSAAFPEDHHEH